MKRASIEPNFHQLYLEFMESVELTNFAKEVLKETYRNIKVCNWISIKFNDGLKLDLKLVGEGQKNIHSDERPKLRTSTSLFLVG